MLSACHKHHCWPTCQPFRHGQLPKHSPVTQLTSRPPDTTQASMHGTTCWYSCSTIVQCCAECHAAPHRVMISSRGVARSLTKSMSRVVTMPSNTPPRAPVSVTHTLLKFLVNCTPPTAAAKAEATSGTRQPLSEGKDGLQTCPTSLLAGCTPAAAAAGCRAPVLEACHLTNRITPAVAALLQLCQLHA